MTSHELARYLLAEMPDLPVEINGWGSDEGCPYEVEYARVATDGGRILLDYFNGPNDTNTTTP